MLVAARTLLGIATQPIRQRLSSRTRPKTQPLSKPVVKTNRHIHRHNYTVAQCQRGALCVGGARQASASGRTCRPRPARDPPARRTADLQFLATRTRELSPNPLSYNASHRLWPTSAPRNDRAWHDANPLNRTYALLSLTTLTSRSGSTPLPRNEVHQTRDASIPNRATPRRNSGRKPSPDRRPRDHRREWFTFIPWRLPEWGDRQAVLCRILVGRYSTSRANPVGTLLAQRGFSRPA